MGQGEPAGGDVEAASRAYLSLKVSRQPPDAKLACEQPSLPPLGGPGPLVRWACRCNITYWKWVNL